MLTGHFVVMMFRHKKNGDRKMIWKHKTLFFGKEGETVSHKSKRLFEVVMPIFIHGEDAEWSPCREMWTLTQEQMRN